jgi:branched-chain amino acid transport system substrate-binding protein
MALHNSPARLGVATACIAAMLAAVGCSSSSGGDSSSGSYKVGMSMDLSGPNSFTGTPAAAGFEAAVKTINDGGGVNGKKIDLQVLDDASDIAKGRANLLQFVSKHDLAVFGWILSDVSSSLLPTATRDKTPIVGLGGPDAMFEPVQPYYFSYELRTSRLSTAILNYIKTQADKAGIDKPRIAIMAADVLSARSVVDRAKQDIDALGWSLVDVEYIPVAPTDVSAQAAKIRKANPDYVLFDHNDGGALVGVRGLRSQGVTVPVVNQWAGSSDSTFEQLGEGYVAFRTYASPSQTDIPAVKSMVDDPAAKDYKKQMINPYFTQGWVAGQVLKKALEKCGKDCSSGADFAKALDSLGTIDTGGLSSSSLQLTDSSHEWVQDVKFYTWDPAAKKVVSASDVVSAMGSD